MYKALNKYGLTAAFGAAVVLILISFLAYVNLESVDMIISVAYVMLVIGVIAAVVMPLYNAKDNPRSLMITGIGVLVLLVLFGSSWGIANNFSFSKYANAVAPEDVRLSGALIVMTRWMLIIAVLGVVVTELRNLIKK